MGSRLQSQLRSDQGGVANLRSSSSGNLSNRVDKLVQEGERLRALLELEQQKTRESPGLLTVEAYIAKLARTPSTKESYG